MHSLLKPRRKPRVPHLLQLTRGIVTITTAISLPLLALDLLSQFLLRVRLHNQGIEQVWITLLLLQVVLNR